MNYFSKFLTILAIFTLTLTPVVFGGSVLATDGNPTPTPASRMEPVHEDDDTEVYSDDIAVHDGGNASAAPGEASMQTWSSAAEEIFAQWEKTGYPDDIGGVYYDSGSGRMGVLLVNMMQERVDELRATLIDDVIFTPSTYSYNELRLVQDEIGTIMSADSGIYSTGVGWTGTGGRVHGFGESGMEFRLVVGVDRSVFHHYSEGFAALYGDRVVVEIGELLREDTMSGGSGLDGGMTDDIVGDGGPISQIVPVDISIALAGSAFYVSGSSASVSGYWLWVVLGVGLAVTLLLLLRLRLRAVPAMQTADGGIVAGRSALSKKQVVDAVRNSAIAPSDELFDRISKQIDTQ